MAPACRAVLRTRRGEAHCGGEPTRRTGRPPRATTDGAHYPTVGTACGGRRSLGRVRAAFFDLDKTVIARSAMVALSPHLLRAGLITRRLMLRGAWSQFLFERFGADDDRMYRYRDTALRITRGWDQSLISTVVAESLIESIEPIVFAEALELIRSHQAAGDRVFIVSASPVEIVQPLAAHLDITDVIASRARTDAHGRYTGELEFYSYGPFKAEAIRAVAASDDIDLASSYAYSDSATDLPMLDAVGHPVAVNPDRELTRIAVERGWEVRHFDHPVRLGSRIPRPGTGVGVALGVTAAATAAGITLWRRQRQALPSGVGFRRPGSS